MGIEVRLPEDIIQNVRFETPHTILCWGGDEPEAFDVGGERIVVPAHNQIANPGERTASQDGRGSGSIFRHPPATLHGEPLPGTVLLKTVESRDPATGAKVVVFDAMAVQEYIMGQFRSDHATALANRGMVALRNPADVPRVMSALRDAYEESMAVSDQRLLSTERERLKKFEEQGMQPTPSQIDGLLRKAMERNARRQQRGQASGLSLDQIEQALGVKKAQAAAAPQAAAPTPAASSWPGSVVDHCLAELRRRKVAIPASMLMSLARQEASAVEALVSLVDSQSKEA
jgi:hypothetical protein